MFVSLVQPVFEALGLTDVNVMSLLVRKCAHFSEYAVLGVIARGLYRALRSEGAIHAPIVFLTVLVPVADECLQLFVPGRSGQLTDVLIDLSGLVTGALVAHAVAYLVSRRAR